MKLSISEQFNNFTCGIIPPPPPGLGPPMYCMPGLGTIIPGPVAGIMPGCRPPGGTI